MADYIDRLNALPDLITVEQHKGLVGELREIVGSAAKKGRARTLRAGQILKKAGLEVDLQNLDVSKLPEERGREIVGALETANKFLADELPKFETALAKKIERVDKNIFKAGVFKAGSQEADNLGKILLTNPSPTEMTQLRGLIGKDGFNKLVTKRLEVAFENASKQDVFNAETFAREIGLTGGRRQIQNESLDIMLEGTKVSRKNLEDFVELARLANQRNAPNVSQFLARRVILSGSLVTGVVGGSIAGGTALPIPAAMLLVLGGRKIATKITSPQTLFNMTRALDDTIPDKIKRGAFLKVLSVAGLDAGLRDDLIKATGGANGR